MPMFGTARQIDSRDDALMENCSPTHFPSEPCGSIPARSRSEFKPAYYLQPIISSRSQVTLNDSE